MRFKYTDLSGFKSHYNFNTTNRIVGFIPDFLGMIPSKPVSAKNYVGDFISENLDLLRSKLSDSCYSQLIDSIIKTRVVYSGGFDSCTAHLKEYFKDNTTEKILPRSEIIRIASLSDFKWFKSPLCEFNNPDEIIENVPINLDAFSGHYTSKIFGKKKKDCDSIARALAVRIWQRLKDRPYKNTYLWSILGRGKDIKVKYDFNTLREVGTRVIMSCESPITVFLMWISQKMNYTLGYSDWNKSYNICGEFNNDKFVKLNKKRYNYDFELEADWSYYDSNIDTNFLEVGASILCCGLPNDKLHNNIIYTFISSIVTKYVVLPPGIVAELNRAQPSGHPAGTLINCNVNLLYWCIIGYRIYGDNYADMMEVEVYGDDTRAYFKYHPNLINIDEYIRDAGLKSDPVLCNMQSTRINLDEKHKIDFLKRRFDETGIRWNHHKMFDKFLYQSKNRNLTDQIGLVISFIESVPTDKDLLNFVKLFVPWVQNNYGSKLDYEAKSRIESILSFLDDDTDVNKRFDYQLGNRVYDKSFIEQLKLHSFSTSRPRECFDNSRYLLNMTSDKFIVIYSLGIVPSILSNYSISKIIGNNHPPPVRDGTDSIQLKSYDEFLFKELDDYIMKINNHCGTNLKNVY